MPTVSTLEAEPTSVETLAARYAGDLIYRALVEGDEPLKTSDVARLVNRDDVDSRLARVVLTTHPEITSVDRKWTLWTRFTDARHTFDTIVRKVINTYGHPIRLKDLAKELAYIYHRPKEIFEDSLELFATPGNFYVRFGAEEYIVPADWLLDTEYEEDDENLFENRLADDEVFPFAETILSSGFSVENPAALAKALDELGVPVKSKAIQFLLWRADKDNFDGLALFEAMVTGSGATLLSDGTWIGPKLTQQLAAQFAVLAEQEVSDAPEAEAPEAIQPLTLSEEDRETLLQTVLDSEVAVSAARLLEDTFEVTPDYRTYADDLKTVLEALKSDDRALWVGSDRFRAQGSLPAYVYSVPGLLDIPTYDILDEEGALVDQMLDDDGFDSGLTTEIMNPLAQDVLDEELTLTPDANPPSNARAVIKYHHKQIGTMPLCQFPPGFFPTEPNILETEFVLPGGVKAQVWVNNEARLLYGLLDWFQAIPIDSGATFTLERQSPERYIVSYNDESEASMFISRNRIGELLTLQERAEEEQLSTFDILREIMEHSRKGMQYLTLLTEVNVARRVTRRMVASILSEYHCFFQRGGAWVYDAKKLSQGFDKSKRKYLKK